MKNDEDMEKKQFYRSQFFSVKKSIMADKSHVRWDVMDKFIRSFGEKFVVYEAVPLNEELILAYHNGKYYGAWDVKQKIGWAINLSGQGVLVPKLYAEGGKIPKTVFTKDGVEVEEHSDKYIGHIFYDADGGKYRCIGYFPKLDDCVYLDLQKDIEVVGCMDGFYFNDPTQAVAKGGSMAAGGHVGEPKYKIGDNTKLGKITDVRIGESVKQSTRQIGFEPRKRYEYHISNDWYNEGQVEQYFESGSMATGVHKVITFSNSSHTSTKERNRQAWKELNEKLLNDKRNPLYNEFQREDILLDTTDGEGYIPIVYSSMLHPNYVSETKIKKFLEYLKGFVSMDAYVYIGDYNYKFNNYLKPTPSDEKYSSGGEMATGGGVGDLEKELRKLQRDLNSSRLLTYVEGDKSEGEMARKRERDVKLARFNEVLRLLGEKDKKSSGGSTPLTAKEYFQSLNLAELPGKTSNYITTEVLPDNDIDLLDNTDEDFIEVKNYIAANHPKALPTYKEPASELTKQDYSAVIDGMKIMLQATKGTEKKSIKEAIDGLKIMMELTTKL